MSETLNELQLLEWNQMGLIPGPAESESDFIKRAHYCLTLKEHIGQQLQADLGEEAKELSTLLAPGLEKAEHLFDIKPWWIPTFFSNYRLSLWHGGCAWIFQVKEDQPLGALLQLRRTLKVSDTYLGLYHRDELVAHESTHVGRMAFEEPQFEEILAYRTSSSRWRQWLGPAIQSSTESMLLVILLGLIFFIDFSLIILGQPEAYAAVMWFKIIPLVVLLAVAFRLWRRHRSFSLCINSLCGLLGKECKALAVTYRLQDKEIKAFAKMTPQAIHDYIQKQKEHSIRWRMIDAAYLSKFNFLSRE